MWCASIEQLSGRKGRAARHGRRAGFPDDWHAEDTARFTAAIELITSTLPHVRQIVSEPGKAMAQAVDGAGNAGARDPGA
jgi:hypothetical protein